MKTIVSAFLNLFFQVSSSDSHSFRFFYFLNLSPFLTFFLGGEGSNLRSSILSDEQEAVLRCLACIEKVESNGSTRVISVCREQVFSKSSILAICPKVLFHPLIAACHSFLSLRFSVQPVSFHF